MAFCQGCGAETSRIRTTYHEDKHTGKVTASTDECDKCSPNSFDPQWLMAKGVPAWLAYPNKYRKTEGPNGETVYVATEEWRQDSEDKILNGGKEERKKYEAALEKKRREGRRTPMSPVEIELALQKIRPRLEARAKAEMEERVLAEQAGF